MSKEIDDKNKNKADEKAKVVKKSNYSKKKKTKKKYYKWYSLRSVYI